MTFAQWVDGVILPIVDNGIIPLIYALTFIMFLIGVVRYFFLGDGDENRTKGKDFMIWGVIGFAVMFAVWGIVHLLLLSLGSFTS